MRWKWIDPDWYEVFPGKIYLFKIDNKSTWKKVEICTTTSEQHHWFCSSVVIVNFDHILELFLVFLLSTLNKKMFAGFFIEGRASFNIFRITQQCFKENVKWEKKFDFDHFFKVVNTQEMLFFPIAVQLEAQYNNSCNRRMSSFALRL